MSDKFNIKNKKWSTQTVTIASGATATIREFTFPLDKDYTRVESAYLVERSAGGNASNYTIGFRNENGLVVRDLTPKEAYMSTTAVPIAERYIPMPLEANGRNVIVTVETNATASADLIFDIIYLLINDNAQ